MKEEREIKFKLNIQDFKKCIFVVGERPGVKRSNKQNRQRTAGGGGGRGGDQYASLSRRSKSKEIFSLVRLLFFLLIIQLFDI